MARASTVTDGSTANAADLNSVVNDYISKTDTSAQSIASNLTVSGTFTNTGNCRIATGSYTGDGTTDQGITGVGFQPKYVRIWIKDTAEDWTTKLWEITDQHTSGLSTLIGQSKVITLDNAVISIDADGFSVDDDERDDHPNRNGVTYIYLALG